MHGRRSRSLERVAFDPEIERTFRQLLIINRSQGQTIEGMAEQERDVRRALKDYSSATVDAAPSCIVRPTITANYFELKPSFIQMVPSFHGMSTEDPNLHIHNFLEICDTLKINGVKDEAIRLRLFPFSLKDKAKAWLISLPSNSITTWTDLANRFLQKFFPPAKTGKLRNEIMTFA